MSTIESTTKGGKTKHWNRLTGDIMEVFLLRDMQMLSGHNPGQLVVGDLA